MFFVPGDSFDGCVLFYFSYRMLLNEPLIRKVSVRINDQLRIEKPQCFDKATLEPALDTATNIVKVLCYSIFLFLISLGTDTTQG